MNGRDGLPVEGLPATIRAMRDTGFRSSLRTFRTLLVYRADRFLSYPPLVQLLLLAIPTAFVIVAWALLVRAAAPGDPATSGTLNAIWWSITRFFDGGTMANDPWRVRLIALGVTASGVVGISLLTAALASKMGERIQDLRSGRSPVVERRHILVLGWDPKAVLLARELARSRQRMTMVVLSQDDKDRIEISLRFVRRIAGRRLRIVVRTGDPRSEQALLRVAADSARTVIVVPPTSLNDADSVGWTLSVLLAVRRAVGGEFTGRIIVEARHADARDLLMLVGERDVAGPGALDTDIVATDDVIAKVLAQSTRQEGIYYTLRRLLAFDDCEFYLERAPAAVVGRSFAQAFAAIDGALLAGLRLADGTVRLNPPDDWDHVIASEDRMILIASGYGAYRTNGTLPTNVPEPKPAGKRHAPAERVLLLGANRTLPQLVRELDRVLAPGSYVRIAAGVLSDDAQRLLVTVSRATKHISVELDTRPPLDIARAVDDCLFDVNAIVILGCEDETDENGDAGSLAMLLWLRHGMRQRGKSMGRVITEVRDPRSAAHVTELQHDFLISSEIVALLLAQEALDPDLAPVYRELMSPAGMEIVLRPRELYADDRSATFGEITVAARARGELALGYYPSKGQARADVVLNPARGASVPVDAGTFVVALAPWEAGFNGRV